MERNNFTVQSRKSLINLKPFVPELPDLTKEELKLRLGKEKIIKLSFNESPYGPFPSALERMKKVLQTSHLYHDATLKELRNKIAQVNGVETDQVVVSNGADEMILLLAQSFLEAGDEVIIPVPTFGQYAAASKLMGAKTVTVPLTNYKINLELIRQNLNRATKMIFLCNPNNPTGTFITEEELRKFLTEVPSGVLVVLDEAYYAYVDNLQYTSGIKLLAEYPNVFVIRTFSKIYGLAALRVGYGIGSPVAVGEINRIRSPFNVNLVGQAAALASLDDLEELERIKELNRQERAYLHTELEKLGFHPIPSETNFILVNIKKDSQKVFTQLAEDGIIIRPADMFGLPNHLRITIGNHEENYRLIQALMRLS
ncbi:MAG TPA: histidinol-phosphate transaminase [Clostridia bacterium]|nr:histidinol-phosphate transaminase [Clostridia bacterium]